MTIYRPAHRLTLLTTVLAVATATVALAAAIVTAMQLGLLESLGNGGAFGVGEPESVDRRQWWTGVAELIIAIPWVVAFLCWVYRANRNARALGATWMQYSPGWSVGWFFVPLACLFMPYLVFREIWRASLPGPGGQPNALASILLRAWWACCVLSSVIQYSRSRYMFGGGDLAVLERWPNSEAGRVTDFGQFWLGHLWQWSWGLLAHDVFGVMTAVLTAAVVVAIYQMQERKRLELPSELATAITATPNYP